MKKQKKKKVHHVFLRSDFLDDLYNFDFDNKFMGKTLSGHWNGLKVIYYGRDGYDAITPRHVSAFGMKLLLSSLTPIQFEIK